MTYYDRSLPGTRRLGTAKTLFGVFSLSCLALGFAAPHPALRAGFWAAGAAFLLALCSVWAWDMWRRWQQKTAFSHLALLVEHDVAACLVTDLECRVLRGNRAASKTFKAAKGQSLRTLVGAYVADATRLIHRVQSAAIQDGIASETVVLPDKHLRICAHQAGPDALLWRLELQEDRGTGTKQAVDYPTLTVGRGGTVLWMNDAARALAGGRVKTLEDLVHDTPVQSGSTYHVGAKDTASDYIVNIHDAGLGREEVVMVPVLQKPDAGPKDIGFEGLPVPLLKLLPEGAILKANRSARALLHITEDEEQTLADVMEGLGRSIPDWLSDAALGKGLRRSEFLRLTRADREVFVQVTLTRIVEQGENLLIAVLNDATELKSLEAQFVQG